MKFYGWLLISFILLASPVVADEKNRQEAPAGPIEVTSQQMEADQLSGQVFFSGEVVAKRGTMTVYADNLTLFFVEIDGERKVERLAAKGSVRVVDGDRIATAEQLDYLQAEEKMTLTGDAEIHQGKNLVSGEEIVLFIRENRSLVKSGKDGRVKAIFLPQQESP